MKTSIATYGAVQDEKGNLSAYPEKKIKSLEEEAKESGSEALNVVTMQSFTVYEVENDTDFLELVPDESERTNLRNRAIVLKQQQGMRAIVTEDGFESVEGEYDLKELCGELRERKQDPKQKVLKMLGKLTKSDLEDILEQFTATA